MNILKLGFIWLATLALNLVRFLLAIAVVGLYGHDLNKARDQGKSVDSKWAYVVAVGALAAFTAVLYMIPFVLRFAYIFVWDLIIFVLFIVAFGIFGHMYINEDPEGDDDISRMKNAVWVVLANALVWLFAGALMGLYWMRHRERHTRFTGRATV